ncbi:hypothetical protein KI387_023202, partial [Taxus chinensis]
VQVFYFAVKTLRESNPTAVYEAVEKPLQLAQTAAILEILHGLVGLVRSPISATLPQIGSRLFVTWGILYSFPEVRTSWLVSNLVLSWSLTEIIRYSFFGLKEAFGYSPSWLQWLRYSTFFLMYPTGISSEVGLIYTALPFIKNSDLYCLRMPNKLNFAFDYFYATLLVLAVYVPDCNELPLRRRPAATTEHRISMKPMRKKVICEDFRKPNTRQSQISEKEVKMRVRMAREIKRGLDVEIANLTHKLEES